VLQISTNIYENYYRADKIVIKDALNKTEAEFEPSDKIIIREIKLITTEVYKNPSTRVYCSDGVSGENTFTLDEKFKFSSPERQFSLNNHSSASKSIGKDKLNLKKKKNLVIETSFDVSSDDEKLRFSNSDDQMDYSNIERLSISQK
jgi:hypothetical protein